MAAFYACTNVFNLKMTVKPSDCADLRSVQSGIETS